MSVFADSAFIALQKLLPQHALSRLGGRLAASRHPWIRRSLIKIFTAIYDVDLSEAARSTPNDYESFNDFFTRELASGVRPLAAGEGTAICPADGAISQAGAIAAGELLQAKGHGYSLDALFGETGPDVRCYENGTFATVYLAPHDYHRVHLPVAGKLIRTVAIPGALYSVNATTEANIDGLFARNERLVCHFETDFGPMAVVLVGAMIVAGIETVWPGPVSPYDRVESTAQGGRLFDRGAEIGRFYLGSTVIVCMSAGLADLQAGIEAGRQVRMGQALFSLH